MADSSRSPKTVDCQCRECGAAFSPTSTRKLHCSRRCSARANSRLASIANSRSLDETYDALVIRRGVDECWGWSGSKLGKGYGGMHRKGRSIYAHRFSYEREFGPIPDALVVRHRCDNPECSNPNHLLVGTIFDNARDAVDRRRLAFGARNPSTKLSEKKVLIIRRAMRFGIPQRKIARRFGVCQQTVSNIARGKVWRAIR